MLCLVNGLSGLSPNELPPLPTLCDQRKERINRLPIRDFCFIYMIVSTQRRATSDSFPPIMMPRATRETTDAQLPGQEIRS